MGGGSGEPWWHGTAFDLAADHGGVFDDVFVGFEGEGGEAAIAVAFDAVGLEDAADVAVVGGGLRGAGGGCREVDFAAWGGGCWDGGGFAAEDGVEGIAEVVAGGFWFGVAEAVLVVERAAEDEGARGIQDEGFGGGGGAEGLEEGAFGVVDDGGGEVVFFGEFEGVGFVRCGDRVDEDEGDAACGVFLFDAGHFGAEFVAERAGGAEADEGPGFGVGSRADGIS